MPTGTWLAAGAVMDNILWIPATSYPSSDAEVVPTGEIAPLKGTLKDFDQPTRIEDRIEQVQQTGGYDHSYILGADLSDNKVLNPAALLAKPHSGRILEVRTTQRAVQLYTGNR